MMKRYLHYIIIGLVALGLNMAAIAPSYALCHDVVEVAEQDMPCHSNAAQEDMEKQKSAFPACCKDMLCLKCVSFPVAMAVNASFDIPSYDMRFFRHEAAGLHDSFPIALERPPEESFLI